MAQIIGAFAGVAVAHLMFTLNLIDRDLEHALQMLRKIRNDFAHSVSKASLSESTHKNRVQELAKETRKIGKVIHNAIQMILGPIEVSKEVGEFCAAVAVILICIKTAQEMNEPFKPVSVAGLTPTKMGFGEIGKLSTNNDPTPTEGE